MSGDKVNMDDNMVLRNQLTDDILMGWGRLCELASDEKSSARDRVTFFNRNFSKGHMGCRHADAIEPRSLHGLKMKEGKTVVHMKVQCAECVRMRANGMRADFWCQVGNVCGDKRVLMQIIASVISAVCWKERQFPSAPSDDMIREVAGHIAQRMIRLLRLEGVNAVQLPSWTRQLQAVGPLSGD